MEIVNEIKLENSSDDKCYYVIHPLNDQMEVKRQVDNLGLMPLSPVVKYSLLSLRLYLLLMGGLVLYRAINGNGLI